MSEATIRIFFEKWMLWVVSSLGVDAFLPIWILFAVDILLLYFWQWLLPQEVLEESIRIFIYQTEQTYIKQAWHLGSFEIV